jgi:glycerophosphoryl diester phosphodiesterase
MTNHSTLQVIAHRGFSARAPENTLAALELAMDVGADAVEFDLQTAACGTPVLIHDPLLGRTSNGVGPVQRRPLSQLKALDAGSWFSPEFRGETIPTQAEALAALHGRVDRVYQDIKGYREIEDLDRMVAITRDQGMAEATVFTSSDWTVMNRLREVAPEIQRAYLVEDASRVTEALARAAGDEGSLLNVDVKLLLSHADLRREIRRTGVGVMAWTVNEEDLASRALEAGASRIFTDEVVRLLAWKEGMS